MDVRALTAFFARRASRRIRDRFARLLQMAQLLSLETPAEVSEYWGTGSARGGGGGVGGAGAGAARMATWELSPEDIRGVLALRIDWSPAEIAKIRL